METSNNTVSPQTIFSWALYDFANTIFSMNVISLYFALWVTVDMAGEDIFYSVALSGSLILAAIVEPITGAMSDVYGRRIPFLFFFTAICCLFTALIGTANSLLVGLALFVVANVGYEVANVFYNALLPEISTKENIGRISGYGVALGYVGTIFGLLLTKPFLLSSGRQAVFLPTGAIFFLFAIPCLLFVKDKNCKTLSPTPSFSSAFKKSFLRIKDTFTESHKYPGLIRYLAGLFIFFNAVNTCIIFMSVYTKKVIGFSDTDIITFYIVSTIFAITGSFIFGFITDKIGSKHSLVISIFIWCSGLFIAFISNNPKMFWLAGPLIGIALGSTWVSSRALLVELCPCEKIGEVFGLYGVAGKSSSVVGSLIWGLTVLLLGTTGLLKYRIAIFLQIMFVILGWFVLRKVPGRFGNIKC
ncbi:MAG: MFS transporter [Elusimicrobiota bacterium]